MGLLLLFIPTLSSLQRSQTPPPSASFLSTSSQGSSRGPSPQPRARGVSPVARSRLTPSPRRSPKRATPSPVKAVEEGERRKGGKESNLLTNHTGSEQQTVGKGKGKGKLEDGKVKPEGKPARAGKKHPAKPLEGTNRVPEVSRMNFLFLHVGFYPHCLCRSVVVAHYL